MAITIHRQFLRPWVGPLSENLGYRFAAQQHSSDGYIRNDFLQRDDTDNIDELSLRSILDWQASDNLDLKLTIFHVDADNGYDAFSLDNTRHTLSDNPGHDRHESTAVAVQSNWQANDSVELVSLLSFADNNLEYGYDEDWAYGDDLCVDFFCPYNDPYNSVDNYVRERNKWQHRYQAGICRVSTNFQWHHRLGGGSVLA